MCDPRVQAMFNRNRHNNVSIFMISQEYYEQLSKLIRANRNTYQIIKTNNFKEVQNIYQDKASKDMTLKE